MNNTTQASGGGGGLLTGLIITVVLILIGVAIYAVYTKLWFPKQCVGQDPDKTSNVSTFMYDSKKGVCVANVCIDGYGDAANKGLPVNGICTLFTPTARSYTSLGSNACATGTGTFTVNSKGTTDPLCQSECDAATTPCTGYQWDSSKTSCSIISDKTPVLDPSETSGTMTCNVPTKIM